MTADVIELGKFRQQFPKAADTTEAGWIRVYTCNCGCSKFTLLQGGHITCHQCLEIMDIKHYDPLDNPLDAS
jgi:hypothetical protein